MDKVETGSADAHAPATQPGSSARAASGSADGRAEAAAEVQQFDAFAELDGKNNFPLAKGSAGVPSVHAARDSSSELEQAVTVPGGFFSPAFAAARRQYFAVLARTTGLIIVVMWICLPVYWGSLANSASLTGNLEAWIVDRDGARIGREIVASFTRANLPGPRLTWKAVSPADAGTDDDVVDMVLHDHVWVVVVVNRNATTRLNAARASGNKSYDPHSAISVYYAQARNEIAASNFVVPITTNLLQQATTAYATGSAQRYFAQVNRNGDTNTTALQMIAQAPLTITPGISWTMVNLRPYTAPAAQALTLVGNIFLTIFAFMITLSHDAARTDFIAPRLPLLPYILLRLLVPLLIYIPLSLSYTLVSLAFDLPFGGKFPVGAGFMLTWIYVYLGTAALGLALEAMITLLTRRFVGFFLFFLIIFNISPVVLPNELQHPFYAYGSGFPVWNLSQALRTILLNTSDNLGLNAAVIIAWIVLSCGTIALFTWFVHRRRRRSLPRPATPVPPPDAKEDTEKGKGKPAL